MGFLALVALVSSSVSSTAQASDKKLENTLQTTADAFQTSTALLTQHFLNLQVLNNSSVTPLRSLGLIPMHQRVFTTKVSNFTEVGVSLNTQHVGAGLHLKISI